MTRPGTKRTAEKRGQKEISSIYRVVVFDDGKNRLLSSTTVEGCRFLHLFNAILNILGAKDAGNRLPSSAFFPGYFPDAIALDKLLLDALSLVRVQARCTLWAILVQSDLTCLARSQNL